MVVVLFLVFLFLDIICTVATALGHNRLTGGSGVSALRRYEGLCSSLHLAAFAWWVCCIFFGGSRQCL